MVRGEIINFAAAMQSDNLLNINLARVSETHESINVELSDRFFANLEQEEISSGDVVVGISVRASAGNIYKVQIKAKGTVVVACDRCLDPLRLEVDVQDVLHVKDADPEDSDDAEMLYLEAGSNTYDFSWGVYEIIETSLPLQRIHPEGECNAEMEGYILKDSDNEDEEEW